MSLVVAIDPGKTTGFCVLSCPAGVIDPNTYDVYQASEVEWSNRFFFRTFFSLYHDSIKAIVIERFKLFRNPKTMEAQINSEFPSVRIIGIVEAYAELFNLGNKIIFQEPNDRKSAQIPRIHHAALGHSDHVRDAYRHGRYWILMHRSKQA